jgi:hypothetical protein
MLIVAPQDLLRFIDKFMSLSRIMLASVAGLEGIIVYTTSNAKATTIFAMHHLNFSLLIYCLIQFYERAELSKICHMMNNEQN